VRPEWRMYVKSHRIVPHGCDCSASGTFSLSWKTVSLYVHPRLHLYACLHRAPRLSMICTPLLLCTSHGMSIRWPLPLLLPLPLIIRKHRQTSQIYIKVAFVSQLFKRTGHCSFWVQVWHTTIVMGRRVLVTAGETCESFLVLFFLFGCTFGFEVR
jgi:hypothetical protein